jgi:iron complex outermembrane recepter protein
VKISACNRGALCAALTWSAVSLLATGTALGEEAQKAQVASLEEVIVTARRKEEDIQKVPIAITAVTPELMRKEMIDDPRTLLQAVPDITEPSRNAGNAAVLPLTRIRGVPGVAIYFADAPAVNAQWGYFAPFFDVQNVQILKGPQGTLFGQASNAGAILIEPNRPEYKLGGYFQVESGDYARKSLEGAVDIPLIADRLALRLAGKNFYREGYIQDIISGHRVGEKDYKVIRATLAWKPTDRLETTTMYQAEWTHGLGQNSSTLGDVNFLPASQVPVIQSQATLNGMTLAQWNAARDQVLGLQLQIGPYKSQGWSTVCPPSPISPLQISGPGPNFSNVVPSSCPPGTGSHRGFLVLNTTKWEFSQNFSLKNILSASWGDFLDGQLDGDQTRLIFRQTNPRNYDTKKDPFTWSDELQVSGKLFDKLDLTAGVFHFDSLLKPNFANPNFAPPVANFNDTATTAKTQTLNTSVYAQGSYDLSGVVRGLSVTAGLRYSHDTARQQSWVLNPNTYAPVSFTGGPGSPAGEASWNRVSYTAGLQYQLSPDTMIYLTNAKGISAGGLQNITGSEVFNPDSLNNLELGLKTSFVKGDWQVRADTSVYYGTFSDVKVSNIVLGTIPGTNVQTLVAATRNAAKEIIQGWDGEINAAFRSSFEFRAYFGLNKAHYTSFPTINAATGQPIDVSDTPIQATPKTKGGMSVTYHLPIDRARLGDISASANFQAQSYFWATASKPITPTDPTNPNTGSICRVQRTAANGYGPLSADGGWAYKNCVPANHNLNVTLTWNEVMGHEGLRAALTATNVTHFDKPEGTNNNYDAFAYESHIIAEPQYIFASLRYAF